MDRTLTTTPEHLLVFSIDPEVVEAAHGGTPVNIRVPPAVVRQIRNYLRTLEPGQEPDLSKFNLPDGVTMTVESNVPGSRLLFAFDGREVHSGQDVTREYVPDQLHLDADGRGCWTFELGERADRRRLVQASFGEDPRGREWIDVTEGQDGSHWSRFEGYREQVDVKIESFNYRKSHDWKGYDDVRGRTYWAVSLDRVQVGEGWHDDPFEAMLIARRYARDMSIRHILIPTIRSWRDADQLIGTKVWYREQPAVVTSLVLDQGCVVVKPEGGGEFKPDARFGSMPDYEGESAKVEILSPSLYWYRTDNKDD